MKILRIIPVEGTDPHAIAPNDLFVQTAIIDTGEPIPNNFRVLTGNEYFSEIARVVMRCELED